MAQYCWWDCNIDWEAPNLSKNGCCAQYQTKKQQPKNTKLETKQKFSSSLPPSLLKKLLRRLVFLLRQSLTRSVPNPAAEQADPALLKFLITGICFVIMDVRENLQPGVREILLKEDSIENFRDSVLIINLFRVFVPLFLHSPILHFRFLL